MDVDALLRRVLTKIKPTAEEQEKIQEAVEEIVKKIYHVGGHFSKVVVAGSAARNTNLRGSSDVDIFIIYPRSVPREVLEEESLSIGKKVLEKWETRYAEHPYIHGTFMGVDFDIVPAYEMKPGERILSATDRTPLHQKYVLNHCKGKLCDDVRLLKAFLKGIGVYGAEIRTKGFSGYLCELLVIFYGGFVPLLKAATGWRPPVFVPIAKPAQEFNDPLVVPDPVDPYRNVASPVSLDSLATFVAASRAFLRRPSEVFFFPPPCDVGLNDIRRVLSHRRIAFVLFSYPKDAPPDVFWGELEHMAKYVHRYISRQGYDVILCNAWTDERDVAALAIEIAREPTSIYEVHVGPPVFSREHSERFLRKYSTSVYGPWIENGRWRVLRPRKYRSFAVAVYDAVREYAERSAKEPLKTALSTFDVLSGRAIIPKLSNPHLRDWVCRFIFRRPHWLS